MASHLDDDDSVFETSETRPFVTNKLGQRRPTIISPRDNRPSSSIYREISQQADNPSDPRLKFKKAIEGDALFFADLWQKGTDGEKEAVREDKYGESSVSVLHLAAKHCHLNVCEILVRDFKIGRLSFDSYLRFG